MGRDECRESYNVGDSVQITDGPASRALSEQWKRLMWTETLIRVMVSMFGRETPVDLELDQAEPVE